MPRRQHQPGTAARSPNRVSAETGTAVAAPARTAHARVRPARRSRRRLAPVAAAVVGGLAVLGLLAFLIDDKTRPLPGTEYPTNGNDHVQLGQPHGAYFTNPPTSGWHLDELPRPGVYTQPMAPEMLGHFMEHGGVWVLYTCPRGCQEVVEELDALVREELQHGRPVALAPYPPPGYPAPAHFINLVSWQYLLGFDDEVDPVKIRDFIERHACRYSPEGTGPGCTTAQRGSIAPAKDAGNGGFKFVTPAPASAPGPARPGMMPAAPRAP